MGSRRQQFSPARVNEIIKSFKGLGVWWVGLHHGSIIYFELGGQISDVPLKGESELRGSAYLGIWADAWRILRQDRVIACSTTVTRAVMEDEIRQSMDGQDICGVELELTTGKVCIRFQGEFSIVINVGAEADDEDIIQLHVPDGRIICFARGRGFYLSDDLDETLLLYWRENKNRD